MRELYVYYRVRADAATSAHAAIKAMQDKLRRAHPGLLARLLRRDEADGAMTWMESYAFVGVTSSVGVDRRIEEAIAESAATLMPFIDGGRHVEAFVAEDD